MARHRLHATAAASALLLAASAGAAEYFVDNETGSDKANGTAAPWQSLARVNREALKPGDVVRFKCGGTWTGPLVLKASGAEGAPITIASYGKGAKPVLRNPPGAKPNWECCIDVHGSWVTIDGLCLRDTFEFGVGLRDKAQHGVVRNCEITAVGIGVGVRATHCLVTRNHIHDLKMVRNDKEDPDNDNGAVGVALFNSDNEVSYNRMIACKAPSYDYGYDGGVVEIYGKVNDCRVIGNWSKNCDGFVEIGGQPGECRNLLVAYNVALNNDGTFTCIHFGGKFGATVENLRLENNTLVDVENPKRYFLTYDGKPKDGTILFRNNIVCGTQRFAHNTAGLTHERNLFFRPDGSRDLGFAPGPAEAFADPLFRDLAKDDLRLRPDSPAVNAGMKLGHALDLAEKPVPYGPAPDLGAYELRPEPAGGGKP
jgi:hypothetical protein